MTGVYQIQSIVHPERTYIGSAVNINNRWCKHLNDLKNNKHHSPQLQNHYKKYEKTDLRFSVIAEYDKEDLLQIETYFLGYYDPYFNTCKVAGSQLGLRRSEETKIKQRKPHGAMSEEAKMNMSKAQIGNNNALGYKHTDEEKLKMRTPRSEEVKLNMSKGKKGKPSPMKGKHFSEETVKHMRLIRKPVSEETKDKLRGKHPSEVTKEKIRKAGMGNKNASGHKMSEESIKQMKETLKRIKIKSI